MAGGPRRRCGSTSSPRPTSSTTAIGSARSAAASSARSSSASSTPTAARSARSTPRGSPRSRRDAPERSAWPTSWCRWATAERRSGALREHVAELAAGAHVELAEDLAQVVLDRARADEELGADLGVGVPVAGHRRDLAFLGREGVARCARSRGHGRAGGEELATAALCERLRPGAGERVVRRFELLASVDAAALAAQPLAVEQAGAGQLDAHPRAPEALDRLAVKRLGDVVLVDERASPREDPERPIGARRVR